MPTKPDLPALDTYLFQSPTLRVGRFEVRPEDPRFTDSGPIEQFPVVFPSSSVWIHRRRSDPVLTDRRMVLFYNRDQRYTRSVASPAGDRCHWFSFAPRVISEVVAEVAPEPDPSTPYLHPTSRCPSDIFLTHHLLIRHLLAQDRVDELFIEEAFLHLLRRIVRDRYAGAGSLPETGQRSSSVHEELVAKTRALLATRYREALTLSEIAAQVFASPFHLSRVFRRHTGSSMHAYRSQLRLRAGLESVVATKTPLTEIALDLGFSSHSHFTSAFRSAFDCTPSTLRSTATRSVVGQLLESMA